MRVVKILSSMAMAAGLAAFTMACGASDTVRYQVRGEVKAIADGSIDVDHEDIPGFMGAMQMNYAVAPGVDTGDLAVGDAIAFELQRDGTKLEIRAISKLPANTTLKLSGADEVDHGDMPMGDDADPWAGWTASPVQLGLPAPPPVPADDLPSAAKVALGHELFMDKRLSFDASRSCYSCHQNVLGNADGRATALGAGDKPLSRNTPTIWNVAYRDELYWDGRAGSLEAQALGAWRGGNMGVGKDALDAKAEEIGALAEYRDRFVDIFGLDAGEAVAPLHVARAISAYERTLLCGDTEYDRGDLAEDAARGQALFQGEAGCVACHAPPFFSDESYHVVGIGFADDEPDPGRGKVTGEAADQGRFKTPTLRNVARTGPYFHDGSAATLADAVRVMASGGVAGAPDRDPLLRDSGLDDAAIGDLVAFLETLSCDGTLVEIGDQRVADITP